MANIFCRLQLVSTTRNFYPSNWLHLTNTWIPSPKGAAFTGHTEKQLLKSNFICFYIFWAIKGNVNGERIPSVSILASSSIESSFIGYRNYFRCPMKLTSFLCCKYAKSPFLFAVKLAKSPNLNKQILAKSPILIFVN